LIRIAAVGICGSEIHAFKGTHPFRKPIFMLGHEMTGQVVEVGGDVDGMSPGDRVFVALCDDPIQLDVNDVIHRHLTPMGTSMYNAQGIMTAMDLISSGKVQAEDMVIPVPLEAAQHGFHLASTKQGGAIKVMLEN
jgi:threonine dehydrogenase-like Zn-dependent dehydrogenase